ncbi:MAG TPA: hypothetical protein VJS42_03335 [Steroidobacteraceae bacterium]|nr:hypothetical protein [Steroidobacteraceae bacterium]
MKKDPVIKQHARPIDDDNVSFRPGHENRLRYSHLFAQVGMIATSYCEMEQELAFFCAYLLGQRDPPEGFGHPVDPVAIEIFNGMHSRAPQRKFLNALIGSRIGDSNWDPIKEMWAAIENAAVDRNFLMHTPLRVSESYPDSLIASPLEGDSYEIDSKMLDLVIEEIAVAHKAIHVAWQEARKKLNA